MLPRYPWGLSLRFLGLILPFLYFLPLFFCFCNSPGNALFYLMTTLMDSGPGGLLHLIDRLGGGTAVTGLLSDGATTPFLLGQFLFQLGRHNSAGPLLDLLAVFALAQIFYFVAAAAFLNFSYSLAS